MDLVDVFAVPSDPPLRNHHWNSGPHQASAPGIVRDPWDSLGESRFIITLIIKNIFKVKFQMTIKQ